MTANTLYRNPAHNATIGGAMTVGTSTAMQANLKTEESRSSILQALLVGGDEPDPFSRMAAAQALARFSSPAAIQAVTRSAIDDSLAPLRPPAASNFLFAMRQPRLYDR
jgi:HEAT repeats